MNFIAKMRKIKLQMTAKANENRDSNFVSFNYLDVFKVIYGKPNFHFFGFDKTIVNEVLENIKVDGFLIYSVIKKKKEYFVFAYNVEQRKVDFVPVNL